MSVSVLCYMFSTVLFFQAKCSVKEVRTVRVSVAVSSVSYTGGSGTSVKKEQGKISLTRGMTLIVYIHLQE